MPIVQSDSLSGQDAPRAAKPWQVPQVTRLPAASAELGSNINVDAPDENLKS